MKSFRALAAVLSYPTPELQAAVPDIRAILSEEGVVGPSGLGGIEVLLARLAAEDIWALQEAYVLLFDRSRTLSLDLFEHVHGEGRDRGGAMLDLLETYRAGGFDLIGPELPDHLPVLLEYLSTQPVQVAQDILADAAPILRVLAERLTRRSSAYAGVFALLLEFAEKVHGASSASPELEDVPDDDPEDLEALDAIYVEAEVVFGPEPGGCGARARGDTVRVDASRLIRRGTAG